MSLVSPKYFIHASPSSFIKTLVLSTVVVSTMIITGCATKPQVNNMTRYAAAPDFYTVRSGDTLSGIAARYGLSYISVAEMNDIAPPYRIYVGQSIRLKNNTTARRTTATQPVTQVSPIQRQTIAIPAPTTPAQQLLRLRQNLPPLLLHRLPQYRQQQDYVGSSHQMVRYYKTMIWLQISKVPVMAVMSEIRSLLQQMGRWYMQQMA